MIIKVLFSTSKRIHPKFSKIKIGKYTVEPIPGSCVLIENIPTTDKYLLSFEDIVDNEKGANPLKEARLFLSYLGLLLGTKIRVISEMIDSLQSPFSTRQDYYPQLYGIIDEMPDFDTLIAKLKSLDVDIAKQYLRACDVYQTAVSIIEENATLSFFLLTVSIECLSTKVIAGNIKKNIDGKQEEKPKGTCDKFVEFIITYLPTQDDFSTREEWENILKEIYYNHRSGFTHGGKSTPDAVLLADRLNRIYINNIIDGKRIKTPGLRWFETIVRRCLIGFLSSHKEIDHSQHLDHFKELSYEFGKVALITKKNIQKGLIVISDENFDLD